MLEDTTEPEKYNIQIFREKYGIPETLLKSLELITRKKDSKETYFDYIRKVKMDELAKAVKLNDIEDHLTYGTEYIPESLIERYKKAKDILLEIS